MKNFKKILLVIYRKFCKKFNYFTFSESEKKGFYSRGFWFKIIRSQKHFSYENGLTVRGVRFDKIDDDPMGFAISKLFPLTQSSEKEFSEILYRNYSIERKMSAAQHYSGSNKPVFQRRIFNEEKNDDPGSR